MCRIALSSLFFKVTLDFSLTLRCLFYSCIYLWHAQQQISVAVLTDDVR